MRISLPSFLPVLLVSVWLSQIAMAGVPCPLPVTIPGAGSSVSIAGDLNGDACDDIVVGAPDNDASGTGAVYVVFGRGY